MPRMTLRLGIIGYGRIGELHAKWTREATGVEPVAVVDPTPARRELAQRAGFRTYEGNALLLEDPSIDAVLVSTPTSMHFDHVMSALRSGKHVMVEKPTAMELAHAKQMVAEARQRGLVLSTFHNRRWDPDYLTLKRAIDEKRFGRVVNVESRLGQWASCVGPAAKDWRPNWRNEAAFGGGGLFDWGSHLLDQMWRLLWPARPMSVFAQLRGNVWTSDCDDLARVCIDFDDGAVGLVEVNTTTTQPLPRWHVDGTTGSASSPHSLEFDTNVWSKLTFTDANDGRASELPRAERGLTAPQLWEQFAIACAGDGEPAVRPESVLPTMALLDAARRSSATNRSVDIRDVVEWVV
jgi:predicted dehydrogenase